MFGLQELVNNLIDVIIDYHNVKTKKNLSSKEFYAKELSELQHNLQHLISTFSVDRKDFMTYLAWIILKLKPILNHHHKFEEAEIIFVSDVLSELLFTVQQLMATHQRQTFVIHYEDRDIKAYGFQNQFAMSPSLSYCETGKQIQEKLSKTSLPQLPWLDFTQVYSKQLIQDFLIQMLQQHNREYDIQQLQEENVTLKAQVEKQFSTITQLMKENEALNTKVKQQHPPNKFDTHSYLRLFSEKQSLTVIASSDNTSGLKTLNQTTSSMDEID